MPELPEVETVVRSLRPCTVGKTIDTVLVAREQSIRTPLTDSATFAHELRGRHIQSLERRAKAIIFLLNADLALVFHFKLGAVVLCENDKVVETDGVALNFSDETCLNFTRLALSEFHLVRADRLDRIEVLKGGGNPLSRSFTLRRFKEILPPGKQLKSALTDQNLIGGIGNAWSDEILWNARLNPLRKVSELSEPEFYGLHKQIKATLRKGIKLGGETGFIDGRGRKGRYKRIVHGREGKPCPRDGHKIELYKKGRKTYWCPECQK